MYFDDCKNPEELGNLIKKILSRPLITSTIRSTFDPPNALTPRDLESLCDKAIQSILDLRTENPNLPRMPKSAPGEAPQRTLQSIREWCIEAGKPTETVLASSRAEDIQNIKGEGSKPTDLIRACVVVERYAVSRASLKRAINDKRLKSHRPPKAPKNSPHLFSEKDIAALWPKRS